MKGALFLSHTFSTASNVGGLERSNTTTAATLQNIDNEEHYHIEKTLLELCIHV